MRSAMFARSISIFGRIELIPSQKGKDQAKGGCLGDLYLPLGAAARVLPIAAGPGAACVLAATRNLALTTALGAAAGVLPTAAGPGGSVHPT